MVSDKFIFWEVDVQADFMLPGGHLYVPGAEKLLLNIRRLTDAARQGQVFLVSHGCFHTPDDPEFQIFPPHCVRGTLGAELVPEAITEKIVRVPNEPGAQTASGFVAVPADPAGKTDVEHFREPACRRAGRASRQSGGVRRLRRGHGILRQFCGQRLLARRRRVAVVQDAIETLKQEDGQNTLAELHTAGARLTTTDQALNALRR